MKTNIITLFVGLFASFVSFATDVYKLDMVVKVPRVYDNM